MNGFGGQYLIVAIKQIRVGSMEDVHQYDNVDFDEALETDEPIAAGAGTDPDHVLIHSDVLGSGPVGGPATGTDEALVRFDGGTGRLIQDSPVTLGDVLKTGATQAAAGAAAGEMWATNGHASLPNNVLMIGV